MGISLGIQCCSYTDLMSSDYFLCLDQGGTHSRAVVISEQAEIISQARLPISHKRYQGGRVEQQPEQLLTSLRNCALQAVEQLSTVQRRQLKACGLVCQRSSLLAWRNTDGVAITPVLSWQDTRGHALVPNNSRALNTLQHLTGLRANAHFGATKMQYLLANEPVVQQAAANNRLYLSPLASYLTYHLLEEKPYCVDAANAQRSLLMNISRNDWDEQLLKHFFIDRQFLPIIHSPQQALCWGHLKVDSLCLPMTLLSGDQSAAVFSHGPLSADTVIINWGTGAFLLADASDKKSSQLMPLLMSLSAEVDQRLIEATVNGCGAALDWLAENYADAIDPKAIQHALDAPDQGGVFINTVGGLGSPDWQSQIKPVFINADNGLARLQSVLESMVFLIQRNLDVMKEHQPKLSRLAVSGGLSKSHELCQRLADLSGMEVLLGESHEATALGMAYCMSKRKYLWPAHAATTIAPRPQPSLTQRYQRWTEQLILHISASPVGK